MFNLKTTLNLKSPFTRIKELEEQNSYLITKLAEKQEHINRTNAFWKGKMRNHKTAK